MSALFRKKRKSSTSKSADKEHQTPIDITTSPEVKSMAEKEEGATATDVTRPAVKARGFFKRAPTVVGIHLSSSEAERLRKDKLRQDNWKRWGPYLSERQWATVREDYSSDGSWYASML